MSYDTKIQWAIEMAHKTHYAKKKHFDPEEIKLLALEYLHIHKQVDALHFQIERKKAQDFVREMQELDFND